MTVARREIRLFSGLVALVIMSLCHVGWLPTVRAAEPEQPDEHAQVDLAAMDAQITDASRDHWAFKPVARPEVPAVRDAAWCRNEIDRFILAKLESYNWRPSPTAEPRALLRRLYLDLVGMPPTPEELAEFLEAPSPEALDARAKRLLGRVEYAERWARHWLDVVRYADSNGYERDAAKPSAWRYRDWVIRALAKDMPFDRFVLEQLAADELEDARPEDRVALGYYRVGPWDDEPADPVEDRFDQLDDIVNTTSQVFLGLTMGCARCHDHKFEPLTMHDYYRLVAVFNGLERPRNGRTELDVLLGAPPQVQAVEARDQKIAVLNQELESLEDGAVQDFLLYGKSSLPPEALTAFRTHREKRSPEQNELIRQYQESFEREANASVRAEVAERIAMLAAQIESLREETPDLQRGYVMVEPKPEPPATHLLIRGKATRPGPVVGPGLPTVLVSSQPEFSPASEYTSRRRLTLARYIASPDHPLTARVIVNRVWQRHFGEGLVRSPNDFGVMGEYPTHPELLDWLAHWFVHEADWSLKKLHKLIIASNSYRMSKAPRAECQAEDPENRRLWRFPYRRLEVEAIRDSMLAVAGNLNRQRFGPPMYPFVPAAALEGHSDPRTIWPEFDEEQASRRTVYAFVKRSLLVPMLEVLDFCDTTRSAAARTTTSVAPQALTLFNGDFVQRQSRHFARRLLLEAGEEGHEPADLVRRAYELALCRPPTERELSTSLEFLNREARGIQSDAADDDETIDEPLARRLALVQLCRVIFNLNEFVYAD